jgi:hypothetical protein
VRKTLNQEDPNVIIKCEARAGEHISHTAKRMVELMADSGEQVECTFNDIELLFSPGTTPEQIEAYFDAESKRRSDEYNARPDVIARRAEQERKDDEHTKQLDELLSVAPPIQLRDEAAWKVWQDSNQDGYGAAVVRFAEKWGRVMQVRMAEGRALIDCANDASHFVDDDGITGFMYGCAAQMLAQCWIHGEELRRWHNLKTQIGTEGESANESGCILNPAILNIRCGSDRGN